MLRSFYVTAQSYVQTTASYVILYHHIRIWIKAMEFPL